MTAEWKALQWHFLPSYLCVLGQLYAYSGPAPLLNTAIPSRDPGSWQLRATCYHKKHIRTPRPREWGCPRCPCHSQAEGSPNPGFPMSRTDPSLLHQTAACWFKFYLQQMSWITGVHCLSYFRMIRVAVTCLGTLIQFVIKSQMPKSSGHRVTPC